MFCEKCGNKISDTARFCPKCGQKVEEPAIMQEQSVNLDGIAASLADKANAILQNAKPVIEKVLKVHAKLLMNLRKQLKV